MPNLFIILKNRNYRQFSCHFQYQDLAVKLTELWNLMDTSEEERSLFDHVTCNISASVDDITAPGVLAQYLIEQVPETIIETSALFIIFYQSLMFAICSLG